MAVKCCEYGVAFSLQPVQSNISTLKSLQVKIDKSKENVRLEHTEYINHN